LDDGEGKVVAGRNLRHRGPQSPLFCSLISFVVGPDSANFLALCACAPLVFKTEYSAIVGPKNINAGCKHEFDGQSSMNDMGKIQ
jgi:hypothetical protein